MGGVVEAILVKSDQELKDVPHVALNQQFFLIPVDDDKSEPAATGQGLEGFIRLTTDTVQNVRQLSASGPAMYCHWESFSGVGSQGAAIWQNGQLVFGPIFASDAINQCLSWLGAEKQQAVDEFESVGLRRHRFTDDWLEEAEAGDS